MMKVLLFGVTGQVGSACVEQLAAQPWQLVALGREQADFADPEAIYRCVLEHKPDVVVNACAYTAVDQAESESLLANTINGDSVGAMGRAARELRIPTIHISTDYVFAGDGTRPYLETDPAEPTGVYGSSKLLGESLLFDSSPRSICLRTSWVFGVTGKNFVKTMLRVGRDRDELGVVHDQIGCPTYAGDLAEVIVELIKRLESEAELPWGIYHCSGAGACSWWEFADSAFDLAVDSGLLSRKPRVKQLTTAEYPTPTKRPAYSVMNCGKLENLLGRSMKPWRLGLQETISSLS